jgi:para-aminobenzoate synthetase component 2
MAQRVVIVDNYDSFTHLLADYLLVLGAECHVVRNDAVTPEEIATLEPSGILLSPGPGRPEDAGITLEVLNALAGRIPILGVCLGFQAIARHFGGTVTHADRPMHGKASDVFHDGRGLYRGLPNPLRAGRYHSLIVAESGLPETLRIVARSDQGELMGLRHRDLAVEGVQFHPESVLSHHGSALLRNWLNEL